ncbi:MAG: DUF4349 domain-containing protein [Solobacterium sp.]|nr:DUF4349 domain-containing protein [Solobacterium sp.]
MKQVNRKGILSLVCIVALCGCSGAKGAAEAKEEDYGNYYGIADTNATADYAGYAAAEEAAIDYDEADMEYPQEYEPSPAEPEFVPSSEKLVYTGSINIESLEYEQSLQNIRERIQSYNGIIENENEYDNDYNWYSSTYTGRRNSRNINMTVRIPTPQFQSFLEDMEGTGKITSRSTNVENITKRYNDTSIQATALEEQQTRLLAMMEKAETIEDMIAIEARLTEVQSQLNMLKSNLSQMDTDVNYSTIYLNLKEVIEYTVEPETFSERFVKEFKSGITGFVDFLEELVLFVAHSWLFLLLFAGVIYGVSKLLKKKNIFKGKPIKFIRRNKENIDKTEM